MKGSEIRMRNRLKTIVLSLLFNTGYFDLIRRLQTERVPILMYHRFSGGPEKFKLSQATFERQMTFLMKKYNFISLKQYLNVLAGKEESLPSNPIVITIDDGYQDNYKYAYPILQKYNIPATIFLTTDFLSKGIWLWPDLLSYILKRTDQKKFTYTNNQFEREYDLTTSVKIHQTQLSIFNYYISIENDLKNILLYELADQLHVDIPDHVTSDCQPLSWDQVREMHRNGVDFGSHTCTHPICSRLDSDALKYELDESKKEIESQLRSKVDMFCYPNGQPQDLNSRVVEQVRNAGYIGAVTTSHGFNTIKSNGYYLNRLSYVGDDYKEMSRIMTRV